jgi:hypothetical protein
LDVAILQIVLNLPAIDDKTRSLKYNYCSRLEAWRCTVLERNQAKSQQEATRRDELLARLIHEEERVLWRQQEHVISGPHPSLLFLGQAAVALVAATMASVGLSAIARR